MCAVVTQFCEKNVSEQHTCAAWAAPEPTGQTGQTGGYFLRLRNARIAALASSEANSRADSLARSAP